MSVLTQYKVDRILSKKTVIKEYWNGIYVKTWNVKKSYNGGDILTFINENEHNCNPNFIGLNEFYDSIIN